MILGRSRACFAVGGRSVFQWTAPLAAELRPKLVDSQSGLVSRPIRRLVADAVQFTLEAPQPRRHVQSDAGRGRGERLNLGPQAGERRVGFPFAAPSRRPR